MGGFSTVTGLETIMNADNASFDGTARDGAMTTNGQLWIGSTASPHVRKGSLTSIDGSVTVTNGAGTINLAVTGGSTVLKTISGDTGTATPSSGNITFNANTNAGKSVKFTASGSTVDLDTTDANSNTFIGSFAGNTTLSGTSNTSLGETTLQFLTSGASNTAVGAGAVLQVTTGNGNVGVGVNAVAGINPFTGSNNIGMGVNTLSGLTTGSQNVSIGAASLQTVATGSNNTAIGHTAGSSYTTSESSNILIKNAGTVGESNAIHIGTQGSGAGQQNTCFVAGIAGVTSVSSAVVAGLATGTGQLVQSTITAGTGITVTPSAGVITIANTGASGGGLVWTNVTGTSQIVAAGNGYLSNNAGTVAFALPASGTIGDVFRIVGVQGAWTLSQAAGQQIKFGSGATTVGVTGSVASNNAGDCIELVATNTSASTVWRVMSSIGTMTLA